MNAWKCERDGCDAVAVGIGGAVGLRAIGWYFEPRHGLFCPVHRPDGSTKRPSRRLVCDLPCNKTGPCPSCKAQEEADRLQYTIVQALEITDTEFRVFVKKYADRWEEGG